MSWFDLRQVGRSVVALSGARASIFVEVLSSVIFPSLLECVPLCILDSVEYLIGHANRSTPLTGKLTEDPLLVGLGAHKDISRRPGSTPEQV